MCSRFGLRGRFGTLFMSTLRLVPELLRPSLPTGGVVGCTTWHILSLIRLGVTCLLTRFDLFCFNGLHHLLDLDEHLLVVETSNLVRKLSGGAHFLRLGVEAVAASGHLGVL